MEDVSCVASEFRNGGLDNLPSEVLSEVASHLDFLDLLSLQQTSKKLRESAEARSIWLAHAKEYSARHFHLYRPETGSLDNIKTDELRAWTRKRLIVDQIWGMPDTRPHFRTLCQPDENPATICKLVLGTRWLLVGYKDGSVSYYNLDLEDPKQTSLIPPSMIAEGVFESVDVLELHIDQGASRLEFKLGIDRLRWNDNNESGLARCGRLDVWQVKLEDGNSLAAEWLNSIPYGDDFNNIVALGPQVLACLTSPYSGSSRSWIEVYWWKECSVTRLLRAHFYAGNTEPGALHLIGDDRVLWIDSDDGIGLYDFPDPKFIDVDVEDRDTLQLQDIPNREPIWSHPFFNQVSASASPLCYDGTTYKLVVSTGKEFWALAIPAAKDENPSIRKFSDFASRPHTYCLGVCKAYIYFYTDGIGVRIGYSWNGDGGFPVMDYSSGRQEAIPSFGASPDFDEANGRAVNIQRKEVIVVNFFR